jgi:GMP synthase-like glutamine amidotransferase
MGGAERWGGKTSTLTLQLRAQYLAELSVYCELHSCLIEAGVLEAMPHLKGVIFSGGPFSVYEDGSPHVSVRPHPLRSAGSPVGLVLVLVT